MSQCSSRFVSYERTSQSVRAEDLVLFGDKMDVKLKNAKKVDPICSDGGTINYKLQPVTFAYPGIFHHSKVHLKDSEWLNLIHHEKVDGDAVGKFLCSVSGHSEWKKDNVWSRYDWCHYRNWGGDEDDDDRWKIYFVTVEKTGKNGNKVKEIGRITTGPECIGGDWYYGLRLVDPDSKLAFAYVFGDALVNAELSCEHGDWPESDFNVPLANFVI